MNCPNKMAMILRTCCLLVGCLATGLAYSMDAFNVFAESLKEMFQYSQSQIELIISLANVGMLSSLPTGLLLKRFGFRILSFVGLIISTGSYILLWSATYNVPFYRDNSLLIAIYFLLSGVGGGIMYITATTVNIRNYETRYLGLVSGLLHSMKSAVLGILMATYGAFFAPSILINQPLNDTTTTVTTTTNNNTTTVTTTTATNVTTNTTTEFTTLFPINITYGGNITDAWPISSVGNLRGYFMFVAALYAITNILAMLVYGEYFPKTSFVDITEKTDERARLLPRKDNRNKRKSPQGVYKETGSLEEDSSVYDILTTSQCSPRSLRRYESIVKRPSRARVKSPVDLIRYFNYHAVLWPSVFMIAYRTCYINNLTSFLTSMSLSDYSSSLVYLIPILGTVLKPIIGVISDALVTRVPRFAGLVFFLLLECAMSALCTFLLGEVSVITAGLVTVIFGSCTVQTQSPAILVEFFGEDSFAYGWGFVSLSWALGTLGLQMMYGFIYDAQVAAGVLSCYGTQCFVPFFTICAVSAALVSLIPTIACARILRHKYEII